jgi:hypothetical protein
MCRDRRRALSLEEEEVLVLVLVMVDHVGVNADGPIMVT